MAGQLHHVACSCCGEDVVIYQDGLCEGCWVDFQRTLWPPSEALAAWEAAQRKPFSVSVKEAAEAQAKAARFDKWMVAQRERAVRAARRRGACAAGRPWVATEAQAAWAARRHPSMDMRDAVQAGMAWADHRRIRAISEALAREELLEAIEEGDRAMSSRPWDDGWMDVEWDLWVASETQGAAAPDSDHRTVLAPDVHVSPYVLDDALCYLLGAGVAPTSHMRGWFLHAAKCCLDRVLWAGRGQRDFVVSSDWAQHDDAEANEVLAWLGRDPSDSVIKNRWCRPDDEVKFGMLVRERGADDEWTELMTEFRRVKLHKTLVEYFGMNRYQEESIVLRWAQTPRGWRPLEQAKVTDWIEQSVVNAGSRLGGYQSCTQSLMEKARRKGRRVAAQVSRREMESILASVREAQFEAELRLEGYVEEDVEKILLRTRSSGTLRRRLKEVNA